MAKIRIDDLLRHFTGNLMPVVREHGERKREERDRRTKAEEEAADRALRLKTLERQVLRDQKADEDRDEERRRRQGDSDYRAAKDRYENANPWVYGGNRYPTEEAMEKARQKAVEERARTGARYRAPRAEKKVTRPVGLVANARGQVKVLFDNNPDIPVDHAAKIVKGNNPALTDGEAYDLAAREKAARERGNGRGGF